MCGDDLLDDKVLIKLHVQAVKAKTRDLIYEDKLFFEKHSLELRALTDKIGTSTFQYDINMLLGLCSSEIGKFRIKFEFSALIGY